MTLLSVPGAAFKSKFYLTSGTKGKHSKEGFKSLHALCAQWNLPLTFQMVRRACNDLIYIQPSVVGNKVVTTVLPAFSILLLAFWYYENSAFLI